GANIECMNITARRLLFHWRIAYRRAHNDNITAHDGRRGNCVVAGILGILDRPGEVHSSVIPEVRDNLAGLCVNRDQVSVAGSDEDSLDLAVSPIGYSSVDETEIGWMPGLVALGVIHPDRLAGLGVDCCHLTKRRADIEGAADHQRRRFMPEGKQTLILLDELEIRRGPAPGDFEGLDIGGIDLVKRRVLCIAAVAAKVAPFTFCGGVSSAGWHRSKTESKTTAEIRNHP